MEKPKPTVKLLDNDGNAFSVLCAVKRALRKAGYCECKIKQFRKEAMSGDYDHLLQTCMKWVDVR